MIARRLNQPAAVAPDGADLPTEAPRANTVDVDAGVLGFTRDGEPILVGMFRTEGWQLFARLDLPSTMGRTIMEALAAPTAEMAAAAEELGIQDLPARMLGGLRRGYPPVEVGKTEIEYCRNLAQVQRALGIRSKSHV
jgi:hypothetical protein